MQRATVGGDRAGGSWEKEFTGSRSWRSGNSGAAPSRRRQTRDTTQARFGRRLFLLATLFHKIPLIKILRTIDHGTVRSDTRYMARYSAFLGRAVEVQYRAGDICLPASGTFVADSGRSIFLEQHYEQCGQQKNFRWEIPYQCIVRLAEAETLSASEPAA